MNNKYLTLSPEAYYRLIIHPTFATDNEGGVKNTLMDFTLMDNVAHRSKIIDLFQRQNILKRRDNTCNIIYTPVGDTDIRSVEVDKIYGATKHCNNEFYAGCMEDFNNGSSAFIDYILMFFKAAIATDLVTNAYFGDISRPDDKEGKYNWNSFNGILYHYARALESGELDKDQSFIIKEVTDPTTAYGILTKLFAKQTPELKRMKPSDKVIYVSSDIFYQYYSYLITISMRDSIDLTMNGIPTLSFQGIPVKCEETFDPVIQAMTNNKGGSLAILTAKGNHIFATDKNYGELTPNGVESLKIWYDYDELTWKYQNFLKAGTQVANMRYSVIGMSSNLTY